MPESLKYLFGQTADFLIMLFLGAAAHTSWQIKKAKIGRKKYTLIDAIISMIISVFTGVVFGLISIIAGQPELAVLISVAVGAWLGVTGLDAVKKKYLGG